MLVFLALTARNWRHLLDPPYWDAIMGVWQQGIWLRQHDWDYGALAQQPMFIEGGSNLNPLYLQAALVGGLGEFMGPVPLALTLHLLSHGIAAVTFVLALRVLLDLVEAPTAWAWALAGLMNPAFDAQVAAVYVDLQAAFGCMLVVFLVHRQRFGTAAAVAAGAFVLKPSLTLLGAALVVFVPMQWLLARQAGRTWTRSRLHLLWGAASLFLLFALTQREVPPAMPLVALSLFLTKLRLGTPLTACLVLLSLLAFAVILLRPSLRKRLAPGSLDAPLLAAILVGGFWCSYAIVPTALIRYSVMVTFPTMIVCAVVTDLLWQSRAAWLGAAVVGLFVLGQQGVWFPAMPPQLARSGEFLERNRLWLDDHHANMALCHVIETHYPDRPLVAKYPFVQMLCSPELGFVQAPMQGVRAVGPAPTTCNVTRFDPRTESLPPGALYIHAPNSTAYAFPPELPPPKGARLLWFNEQLGGRVGIYELSRPN